MRRAHYRRQEGLGAAAAVMIVLAVSCVVFLAVTRWGLDLYGPWLAERLNAFADWLRDGWG